MKRTILLLLIFSMIICMSACTSIDLTTETKRVPHSHPDNLYYTRHYDEYCQYVTDHPDILPDDFVHADSLSAFGSFFSFNLYCAYPAGITYYSYVIDVEDTSLTIGIKHNDHSSLIPKKQQLYAEATGSSFASLSSTEDGFIQRNDFIYIYSDGVLDSILFRTKDNFHEIYFAKNKPFPYSESPIMKGLVSKDAVEFQTAVGELESVFGITT